jgi:hypothetical protein
MEQSQVTISQLSISPGAIASQSAELNLVAPAATRREDTTTKKPTSKRYGSLKMELTVKGETENVDQFLELVERMTPFTSIVELTLSTSQQKKAGSTAILTEAEMLLETYYYTQVITTSTSEQLPVVGDRELRVFNTIQEFIPSGFRTPTEIQPSDVEDLFKIQGFELRLD